MIIKPMIRSNICLNSHPSGCVQSVKNEIDYVKKNMKKIDGAPKLALVIGCSTGYGLSSRIGLAFGYGTATVGISFEKAGTETKPGTPGFYNNLAFDKEAGNAGLVSKTLDGDAFSNEMKDSAIAAVKEAAALAGIPAKIDLVIYSLASPVRTDPKDGVMYRSVIKPIGKPYSGKTIDMMTGKFSVVTAEPATDEEIANTIKVMGGEDWEIWMDALSKAGVLADNARTVAYTYIGPELSWEIYKNGTIGRAKEDLERAGNAINEKLSAKGGAAWISVNKALVTRASAVIPIIPFYISTLFKIMKAKGTHEGCVEQLVRLYNDRLYTADAVKDAKKVPVDNARRIRIDDWEMTDEVQNAVNAQMAKVTEENIFEMTDIAGVKHDFMAVNGFDVAGVDYEKDVKTDGI
jgi:enoyl-[acyl-carrier protein] reductase/trans-2-enoyl-CoA reductase (NAD+)